MILKIGEVWVKNCRKFEQQEAKIVNLISSNYFPPILVFELC